MRKWLISSLILAGLALILFVNRNAQNSVVSASATEAANEAGNEALKKAEHSLQPPPPAPNGTGKQSEAAPAAPSYLKDEPADIKEQKAATDKLEEERFKALNKAYTVKMEKMLKTNEIASLRQSILEDEQTLKKIEASGSDIEGYKFVEKNLQVRKARLKKLLQ